MFTSASREVLYQYTSAVVTTCSSSRQEVSEDRDFTDLLGAQVRTGLLQYMLWSPVSGTGPRPQVPGKKTGRVYRHFVWALRYTPNICPIFLYSLVFGYLHLLAYCERALILATFRHSSLHSVYIWTISNESAPRTRIDPKAFLSFHQAGCAALAREILYPVNN